MSWKVLCGCQWWAAVPHDSLALRTRTQLETERAWKGRRWAGSVVGTLQFGVGKWGVLRAGCSPVFTGHFSHCMVNFLILSFHWNKQLEISFNLKPIWSCENPDINVQFPHEVQHTDNQQIYIKPCYTVIFKPSCLFRKVINFVSYCLYGTLKCKTEGIQEYERANGKL